MYHMQIVCWEGLSEHQWYKTEHGISEVKLYLRDKDRNDVTLNRMAQKARNRAALFQDSKEAHIEQGVNEEKKKYKN